MMKNNGETDSEDNDATFSFFFFFYTQLKKLKEVNFWDTSNLR